MDEADFTNMRRKINYIADYMYMVTKPPTGAEPRIEQFVKHKAVVEKLATKVLGEDKEEWLEAMARGMAEFSREGERGQPFKFLQKQFAWWIPIEEEEKILEEAKKHISAIYSLNVAVGRQMTESIETYKGINREQKKFLNLLEQDVPPHPREFYKMAIRFGLDEKDVQDALEAYLTDIILGTEIYHARITPKLLEKLQEQIELGAETIDLEDWSEKFVDFILTEEPEIGEKFVRKLTGRIFDEEATRQAVGRFATLTKEEVENLARIEGVSEMFIKFFQKFKPKLLSELPAALFYPVIQSIGGEVGDKIRSDFVVALTEGTVELFIEKLEEDFGAHIPEKVKELLRSKRGVCAGEIKLFAQDLAKDTMKYIEKGIIQIALYRGTAKKKVLEDIITIAKLPGFERYLGLKTPEEITESLEKAVEAKKKWEREIVSKIIEKGLGESFDKTIDPLLELLKGTDTNVDDIKKKIEDFLNNLSSIIQGE